MDAWINDLNGSALNDIDLLIEAAQEPFRRQNLKPPSFKQCVRELAKITYFWEWYGRYGVSLSRDDIRTIYYEHYLKNIDRVTVFPDVFEALEILRQRGTPLFLVTGFPHQYTDLVLQKTGLDKYFVEVHAHTRNKAGVLEGIVRRHSFNPKRTYYIGDMPFDIRQTNQAGVISVAVLRPHVRLIRDLVTAAGPAHTIADFREGVNLP